jgi:DDB1- and CUL4-associated factor 13
MLLQDAIQFPHAMHGLLSKMLVKERRVYRCLCRMLGHTREVKGLAVAPNGEVAVSSSADCTVKLWKVPAPTFEQSGIQQDTQPVVDLVGQSAFLGVDYHHQDDRFATCGDAVQIWDTQHSVPIQTLEWGSESVYSVRFNPVRFW